MCRLPVVDESTSQPRSACLTHHDIVFQPSTAIQCPHLVLADDPAFFSHLSSSAITFWRDDLKCR